MTLIMHLEHGTYRNNKWYGWGVTDVDRHGWQSADEATTSWRTRGVLNKRYLNGRETTSNNSLDSSPIIQRIWFGHAQDTALFELERVTT